jgi:hypothetical protein
MKPSSYHHIAHFGNGYSASIISSPNSYGGTQGLFEIAVLHDEAIVYDTPITRDVLGFLTFAQVAETLEKIAALPSR